MHKEDERTKKVILKYSYFVLKDSRDENNLKRLAHSEERE